MTPPPGHKKNLKEVDLSVTMDDDKDRIFTAGFTDEPFFCKNELVIEKLGAKGEKITGVVYKVEFFDSPTFDRSKLKRTWYLESKDGIVKMNDDYVTKRLGYKSDPFYMHDGKVVIPIDCYIQFTEVAAPAEYIIDEKPFGFTTKEEPDNGLYAKLSKRVYNDGKPCEIKIKKIDSETGEPMVGVEFELKFLEASIKETPDKAPHFKRFLDEGKTHITSTNADGELRFDGLDQGKYQITEIKTNTGKSLLKDPIFVTLPLVMTEDEANAYGNVDFSSAKNDASYSDKWYFYSCLFEITNHAHLKMPMSGGLGTWKYGFFGF